MIKLFKLCKLSIVLCAWLVGITLYGQQKKYSIVFYNVENLFDVVDDKGVIDEEFLPQGTYKWTEERYRAKLDRLAEVFYRIAAATSGYPIVIGVSEIENRGVLQDLAAQEKLAPAGYRIAHFDSPDLRGVDVAFFYRPDVLQQVESRPIRVIMPDDSTFLTRDILHLSATIADEKFHFFVNHWPSRRGGQQSSESKRMTAAQILRRTTDSITAAEPDANIVIMGDLNDDPTDKSVAKILGAKGALKDLAPGDLFNPMYALFKAGYGTLAYRDTWNLFDNIIVNANLMNGQPGRFQVYRPNKHKYYAFIFNKPFLTEQEGRYKGYPLRTYSGTTYQGGYSDHFPVYLSIIK